MKKITKLITIIMALVVLTACSGANDKPQTVDEVDESQVSEIGELVDDGVLNLGTCADFPPYEFYEGDEIVGIDADLAKAIGEKLGLEVKLHDMDFSAIIASIESGKLDGGLAGFTVTEEREKQVNFTDTYAKTIQKVLVKKGSDITELDDLEGKKIGAQLGTTGDIFAKDDFGEENVQTFGKYSDAVLALQNGKVDALIVDEQTAEQFKAANEDLDDLDTTYAEEEYAIALTKDNEKLLEEVNKVIDELKDSGELDEIISEYIK